MTLYSYRCEACGGGATWKPSAQQVACRSCGTVVALPAADAAPAASFPLVTWLRDSPENRRTFTPARVERPCPTCSHSVVFEAAREGAICPACQTPLLRPPHESDMPIRPTGVVPFRIDEADARDRLRAWWHRQRGSDPRTRHLEPAPLVARYVPYWQFSARVSCTWRHTTQDSGGRQQVREGEVSGDYGEPEPGNHHLPADLLNQLTFPFEHAVAYDRRYLAGAVVEQYDADIFEAWWAARGRIESLVNCLVDKDSGVLLTGPEERWPNWSNEKGWLILRPFYTTSVDLDGAPHAVIVDGYGGEVASTVPLFTPLSVWLVLGVMAAVLVALAWWAIAMWIA